MQTIAQRKPHKVYDSKNSEHTFYIYLHCQIKFFALSIIFLTFEASKHLSNQ